MLYLELVHDDLEIKKIPIIYLFLRKIIKRPKLFEKHYFSRPQQSAILFNSSLSLNETLFAIYSAKWLNKLLQPLQGSLHITDDWLLLRQLL